MTPVNYNTSAPPGHHRTLWVTAQYGSPFVFAAAILFIGFRGGDFLEPQTIEGAVKLTSWLDAGCYAYMFIQALTAVTQPPNRYLGRALDIALSVVPALALVVVMTMFWLADLQLNVVQRKFLWAAAWACAFDMIVCTIIAFRISLRSIGFGTEGSH
jgi:hypothetical protein